MKPHLSAVDERTIVRVYTSQGGSESYLRECWRYRNVLRFLARRDLVVRYRRTVIGLGWVLIKPLLAMVIFTVIFGHIAHMPSQGMPYPLLVLTGMICWQFFASVVNEMSISLANNPSLITKVWLPRILLPSSSLILNSVDVLVNGLLLIAVLCWYHVPLSIHILAAPLAFVPVVMISMGVGLALSALMVSYRDIKNIIPILLQFGLLCSPVAFTLQGVTAPGGHWLWCNPLAAPIEWFRWSILPGGVAPTLGHSLAALAGSLLILLIGIWYFRRSEGLFADVI